MVMIDEARPDPDSVEQGAETTGAQDTDDVWDALRNVVDPELHMNLVDLGLVYGVEKKDTLVDIKLTLTSPGCPYGPYILHDVDRNVRGVDGVDEVNIDVVWDPPWGPEMMTEEAKLELGFDL
jgi:metal-sulfur cluster biosynthetic enzyme